MSMPRRVLRRFVVWLLLPLLFAQWAAAAYACPRNVGTEALAAGMSDMPDCQMKAPGAAMDPEQPLLCKAHCERGSQAVNDPPPHDASPQLLLWAVLDWSAVAPRTAQREEAADVGSIGARPAGALPLYLMLRVLRN